MKKVGKEVLFLHTSERNARNGESTMLRLKDGRILHAYTAYIGNSKDDGASARICGVYSADQGESWSAPRVLLEKPRDAQNIMSPSLLRLADGALGIVYLRKDAHRDGLSCMPVFSRSEDEGESWSAPVFLDLPRGYYCAINDGAITLRDGGLCVPLSYAGERLTAKGFDGASTVLLVLSRDNGKTWQPHPHTFRSPIPDAKGLQEPGVCELEDGTLWVWMRTAYGHQYQSLSKDGGKRFSPVLPNLRFPSPDAPMRIKQIGGKAVAIYNPLGYTPLSDATELWGSPKRTPLVLTLAEDDGASLCDPAATSADGGFRRLAAQTYYIEDSTADSYCYPAICETEDGILVSYYHSDGGTHCLNATKITKIYRHELA